MVQKDQPRLGRPREYDPEAALQRATEAFWNGGFSGTSLDDLSAQTGMNRPSLYAAFGDKQALYLKTLEGYLAARRAMLASALAGGRPLSVALRAIYERMIDRFLDGKHGARGCYLVGTAVTEAVENPAVRKILAESVQDLEEGFRSAFAAAQARGELVKQADPRALAALATAMVHTLALRARAGQPRAVLQSVADLAVKVMFSQAASRRRPQRHRKPSGRIRSESELNPPLDSGNRAVRKQ
jgi:TetR/AcrR family transcriptional regulator, copper-responsive repressor